MSPEVALFGSAVMSDLSPKSAPKRTSADHSELMGSRPSTTLAESFCAEVLHGYVSDNVGTVETAAKG